MSEVAQLRRQIQEEYEAAHAALHGLAAGTARHEAIIARMERAWQLTEQLASLVGMEEAAAILAEAMEGGDVPGSQAVP